MGQTGKGEIIWFGVLFYFTQKLFLRESKRNESFLFFSFPKYFDTSEFVIWRWDDTMDFFREKNPKSFFCFPLRSHEFLERD